MSRTILSDKVVQGDCGSRGHGWISCALATVGEGGRKCQGCWAREAKHQLERTAFYNRLFDRLGRALDQLEPMDRPLVWIATGLEQHAWYDATGYYVFAETADIAQRGAQWLMHWLNANGETGGFSNVWGASAKREIRCDYVKRVQSPEVGPGLYRAFVCIHTHMIGD